MKNEFIMLQRMFLQEISDIKELGELKLLIEKIIDESTPSSELPTLIENIESLTTSSNAHLARESMLTLGRFYYDEIGVVRDYKKSFELFKKSHELGSLYAAVDLATCYVYGLGTEANSVLGIKILEDAFIEMPHCHVLGHLGSYYKNGTGVEKNYNRALKYLTEAVKKNNPFAANNLAIMYEDGLGVQKNAQKAFELYSLSAKLGYTLGKCHLGDCYRTGVGVDKCPSKAFQILLEAYNEDSPVSNKIHCAFFLAKCYQAGVGTPVDKKKAFDLFLESVTKDKSPRGDRAYTLGLCYELGDGVDSDQETALKYYQTAADNDDSDAIYKVGKFYLQGIGCKCDPIKAKTFLEKAAAQNVVKAFVSLGEYYSTVEPDFAKAIHYYSLAYNKNDDEAPFYMGQLFESKGTIEAKKQALKYYKYAVQLGFKDAISKVLELEKVLAEICENERRSPELESQRKGDLQIQIEEYLRKIILQLQSQPEFNVESKILSEKKEFVTDFLLSLSPLPKTCKDNQLFFDTRSLELLSPRAKKLLPNNIQFTFDEFSIFFSKAIANNVKDKNAFLQLLLNCSSQYQRYLASEGERKKRQDNEQMDSLIAVWNELTALGDKFENSFSENLMLKRLNEILEGIPEAIKNLKKSNSLLSTANFESEKQQRKKGGLLETNARREKEIKERLNEINGLFEEINKISKSFRKDHKIKTQEINSLLAQKGVLLKSNTYLDNLKYYEQNCRLKAEKINELYEIISNLQNKIAEDYTEQYYWPRTEIYFYQEKAMKSLDLEFRDLMGIFEVFKNLLKNKKNIKKEVEKEVNNEIARLAEEQEFIEKQREERRKRNIVKVERKKKFDNARKQEKKQEKKEQKADMLAKRLLLQKEKELTLVSPKEDAEASSRADWQGDEKGHGERLRLEVEKEARKNTLLSELNSGDTRLLFSQMMVPCERRGSTCYMGEGEWKEVSEQEDLSLTCLKMDSRSPSPSSEDGRYSPSTSSSSCDRRSPSPSDGFFGLYKRSPEKLGASEVADKCRFLDHLSDLRTAFENVKFTDIKTENELIMVRNTILCICARAMESLKSVRSHGSAMQNIARNFRNMVYHCVDTGIIPNKIKECEMKIHQEWLRKDLYPMVESLLLFLSSDKFKKRYFDDQSQIIEAVGSPLFSKIVSCNIREPELQDCVDQLELGVKELSHYDNISPGLTQLKPYAEAFTDARLSTYATHMKWGGKDDWKKVFKKLPHRELIVSRIKPGIDERHQLKRR